MFHPKIYLHSYYLEFESERFPEKLSEPEKFSKFNENKCVHL